MLKRVIFASVLLYVCGFVLFAAGLPRTPGDPGKPDAIVALTGGEYRLDVAVALLEKGTGKRLLISGVNTRATKDELKTLLHGKARFDCCADLGYAAENTFGNAKEAAAWTRFHGFKSILLVTSRYHMPRSVAEFTDVMPGVTIMPYPVDAEAGSDFSSRMRAMRTLHAEYVKFLAVTILTAAGLEPGLDRGQPEAESANPQQS